MIDFILDFLKTEVFIVNGIVNLIYGVEDLIKDSGVNIARIVKCQIADDVLDTAYFILNLIEPEDAVGQEDGLVLNEADFVLDLVKAEDIAVDAVIDLVNRIVDLVKDAGIEVARQVADDILDTANLILNLIEAEDAVGQEDGLVLNEADLIFDLVKAKDIAVDAVIDLVNRIVDLVKDTGIEVTRQVADDILNTANLILNLVEAEDTVG